MELNVKKTDDIYVIDVIGEMDLYNSYKLKELVTKMIEKGIALFVINLEQVDYIDSSGIGTLIFICTTIKKKNSRLFISNIQSSVQKVIELTKLSNFFPIIDTVDNAVIKLHENK